MDLQDFLTEEEVRHYNKFLTPGQILIHPRPGAEWSWTATVVRDDVPEADRRRTYRELTGRKVVEAPEESRFVIEGDGAVMCSPSQMLALSPEWCWDVCNYYAALGVRWRATRGQLRAAFMRRGAHLGGPGNARLSYILKQLLDRTIRRAYDRMPLGGLFLQDKDVELRLKQAAHMRSAGMAAEGIPVTTEDVLAEWGFGPQGEPPGTAAGGAQQATAAALPRARMSWPELWSWYRVSGDGDESWRSFWLERWQLLLVREFAARGMTEHFAVGLYSGTGPYVTRDTYTGSLIIFLGKGEPSPQMASGAAGRAGLLPQ
jgi:hypothetical protein